MKKLSLIQLLNVLRPDRGRYQANDSVSDTYSAKFYTPSYVWRNIGTLDFQDIIVVSH
jgi:hypothetical protein